MIDYDFPEILDIPSKLIPIVTEINNYRYCLLEGGRNSTKSHTVARFLLYLAEQKTLRIVCGREIQKSIEDSVHALFSDLIKEHDLFFDIQKATIRHKGTGSTIRFVGLREQGIVNVKSLEGCDIFWGEEAQSFTKATMNILIPTIRKLNAKLFFTMNRYIRADPAFALLAHRKDCLHIHINFNDVEKRFITSNVYREAEECQLLNIKDYNHTWLGQPLSTTTDYMFNFDKLAKAKLVLPFGDLIYPQKVMATDFASGGGDLCVSGLIERTSNVHWKLKDIIAWDNPDTDESVGKVLHQWGIWQPDLYICDKGGLGYPMFITLSKTIQAIVGFDGGSNDKVKTPTALNNRYQAYDDLKYFVDKEWLQILSQHTIKEMETIKKKYDRGGRLRLMTKQEQRKDGTQSQDRADMLSMAVFGARHFLGKVDFTSLDKPIGMRVTKKNVRKKIGRG